MLFLNIAIRIQFKQHHTVRRVKWAEGYIRQTNIIKQLKKKLEMETNNHLPDATHTAVPTSDCNNKTWDCGGEQNTTVTLRNQQQRAQSSLTFATIGSKPITSTHIWTCAPGQTHSLHRAREERRDGIWLSHMMVVRISLPTTQSLPTSPSQEAFSTPPHSFSAIHSILSSSFLERN